VDNFGLGFIEMISCTGLALLVNLNEISTHVQ
jgi:hypothetical protein